MSQDEVRDQNPVGVVAKETVPVTPVAAQQVENLAIPTHSQVVITQPLKNAGVAQIPVAKLPDEEGMQPSPPNFGSIKGDLDLPIPIERAREIAGGDPTRGETDLARVEVHETGKLEERKRNLAKAA